MSQNRFLKKGEEDGEEPTAEEVMLKRLTEPVGPCQVKPFVSVAGKRFRHQPFADQRNPERGARKGKPPTIARGPCRQGFRRLPSFGGGSMGDWKPFLYRSGAEGVWNWNRW